MKAIYVEARQKGYSDVEMVVILLAVVFLLTALIKGVLLWLIS